MRRFLIAAMCGCLPVPLISQDVAPDATEIIRQAVQRDQKNYERLQNYTFLEKTEQIRYDKDGTVDSRKSETEEVMMVAGHPYYKVVSKDGEALTGGDARKEQEKLDKEVAKRLKDPEKDKAEFEKKRAEERRYLQEIPDAYNFTLVGVEKVDGQPVWRIHAEPRPGFKPKEDRAENLKKVKGDVWIDQQDYQWVKAELTVIDTISRGWFLLRIPPGATVSFSQTRVNDEVWLPKDIHLRADAKVGLLRTYRLGLNVTYNGYKKFSSDAEIVGVQEVEQ